MPTLETTVNGIKFPNPFVIASGPPGTNARVICRSFAEGWGGASAKTVSLDASKIVNTAPRYGRLKSGDGEPYGWENIELISTMPLERWLDEFKEIKDKYPDRVLIASIMEEFNKDAWFEIIERCESAGVDMFECNFSCPHGLPERKMGAAMGEDPAILTEVCGWVRQATTKPVWAKMTPNVTHIEDPSRAALAAGIDGISAINTIRSVIGVDLETLRPMPTVEGYSTVGGYSSKAIKPISLRMNMEVATLIHDEFPGRTLSGIGGIETGNDAAEFILLGADTVQVCTGVMLHGYDLVKKMSDQLLAFMDKHGFETIDDFKGKALPYFTTHSDLVQRQAKVKAEKEAARAAAKAAEAADQGITQDENWDGDDFVKQSDELVG
ncbi:NAD-dependent dihydropyrimidine dehydrogenase subunit PreA [Rubripirellula lacrimiformis]|uniref:dihydrouracil dehydrogenase (NAD(+)) n=1 Tax=Rubripirellula lacrimiformis TaxID=1930273 RepID=A0A517N8D7_9BACT|nr:NAD-dependent dihydropyrimidine dehydrogenase subunit PreA [Rubripirellula lacrimiformis]QDT03392.1 NAD-dependent dihydropyrimidine dehydrogenase subunit PreA [Rubripirellula lacrimiformis]